MTVCSPNTLRRSLPLWWASLLILTLPQIAVAELTITPITWDVVGLDSNRPLTSGPELFPVGAEVCTSVASASIDVDFVWPDGNGGADPYINLRPGSLASLSFTGLGAGECVDAYFEVQLTRDAGAFGNSREYRIEATDSTGTVSTPSPRQILVEYLVSQNRNTTVQIRYGQQADESDWVIYGTGSLNLAVGETYFIELTTETSTAYEELQSFLTLSNTIFQVLSVETTYTELTGTNVPTPNPRLWADGCVWDSNPDSPNYSSCLEVGKAGGTVVTTYEIRIVSGGGDSVGLEALIYDRSGGSFHYNTDYSESPGEIVTYDATDSGFSKRFLPSTISPGGISTLLFTITNPNPVELSGYTFTDNLPAGVEVAATPNASSSCGGTWAPAPADTSLSFDIGAGVIGPNSSCSIRVDVTAASTGSYDNVSNNLFLGDLDTGNNATDTLTVNNGPIPPPCAPGVEAVRWSMDGETAPPAFSAKHADVSTATSSFTVGGSPSAPTNEVRVGIGNPNDAWVGRGWEVAANLPGPNDPSYFEFSFDSSAFASDPAELLTFSIDVNPLVNGDWATAGNITLKIHASADGAPFAEVFSVTGVSKTVFTTHTVDVPAGLGTTAFRVNVNGRNNTKADAELAIDNVFVTGCGPGAGVVPDPPELSKSFSPDPIGVGNTSTLTFTLANPNAGDLTEAAFGDTLPAGMTVADPANAANGCTGGTWAPSPGDTVLSFSGGTIPAAGCTLSVDLTASTVGDLLNVTDFITALESGQNATPTGSGSDTLTVLGPPSLEKAFDPELVLLGSTPNEASTLTFRIVNPNPGAAISGVSFSDTFPAGLVVADPTNASSGCGGTWSPTVGAGSVSFTGGSIGAGATCLVSVDVTGPAGVYDNVSSPVSHVVGGVTSSNGETASATVVIDDPIPAVVLSKQVGLTSNPDGAWYEYLPVETGTDVYYKLIVENIGETTLATLGVSDPSVTLSCDPWPDPLPLADAVEPPPHVAECIVGPFAAMAGKQINTATATADGGAVSDTDTATYATVGLTLDKVASPLVYATAGETIDYTFTVTNSGAAILAGPVTIDDALVPGATCPDVTTVGNGDGFFDPGETVVCTGSYMVQAADVTAGSIVNTATASADGFSSPPDNATVTLAAPALTTVKALTSNADGDASGTVTEGDVLTYTVTVTNTGNVTLTNVVVSDSLITPTGGTTPCASVPVSGTCTLIGTYEVTAADVTAGSITNTGTGDSDETDPDTDVLITPITSTPSIGVAKRLAAVTDQGGGVFDVGLEFVVENLGNVDLTDVQVTDDLAATFPAPVTFAVQSGPSTTGTLAANAGFDGDGDPSLLHSAGSTLAVGASGTIALTVRVTLNGATGPFSNTSTATAQSAGGPTSDVSDDGTDPDPNGNGNPGDAGEDDPTPISVTAAPDVSATKASTFQVATQDNDDSGTLTPGDDLTYTIELTNSGTADATDVFLDDTPDANTALVVGSVTTTQGAVVTGNTAGDASVSVSLGTLPSGGGTATVTFEVTIADPFPEGVEEIVNQGVASGSNFPSILTDDPNPPADDDPTVTVITTPGSAVPIPTLGEWASIFFALILAAAALRTMRP